MLIGIKNSASLHTNSLVLMGLRMDLDGLHKNVEMVAKIREDLSVMSAKLCSIAGWLLMLNIQCDLLKHLRPYKLKWMEECLIPEDLRCSMRKFVVVIPYQTLLNR